MASRNRFFPLFLLILLLAAAPPRAGAQPVEAQVDRHVDLNADAWRRVDRHDGYVTGNGRIYAIGGLGQTLTRAGKSALSGEPAPLTRLAWVVGPHYTIGNLGYGWEVVAEVDGRPHAWTAEQVVRPTEAHPFWGVRAEGGGLRVDLADVIVADEPVLLRRLQVTRPEGAPAARVRLFLPVYPDPRNGAPFRMWSGREADRQRPSVPEARLRQVAPEDDALVLVGAPRALWQEVSTPIPPDSTYRRLFPARALATSATSDAAGVDVTAGPEGLHLDLGTMAGGDRRVVGVWLVTVSGEDDGLEAQARAMLRRWKARPVDEVVARSRRALPEPVLRRLDADRDDPLTGIIRSVTGLVRATQAHSGGVLAQPYMYPMCYIRDQQGSFKLLLAQGEYERAYDALAFYIAMQNRYGIQNAYDATPYRPDPTVWHPDANARDGHHRVAEVPSVIILMARDLYAATGDLARIAPLYDRLAYNLRVQEPSANGLLPSPGDESYTNSVRTAPRDRTEMTDSNLLFLAAADFMAHLADTLGRPEDAAAFRRRYDETRAALMARLWLPEAQYFAYARDASDDPAAVDRRPALDPLLRWFWLELGDPAGPIPQGNLDVVLDSLVDPVRVVPEVYDFTAGMDPGYLLHALARSQHPAMHEAARLMERYASDAGLFAEYYAHADGVITPFSGTLRPWESGINAYALVQYLLGLRPDLPRRRVSLQPHLPPSWQGWTTRRIELPGEGALEMTLRRADDGTVTFDLTRHGGHAPLTVDVAFGGFGPVLAARTAALQPVPGRPDVLRAVLTVAPGVGAGGVHHRLVFEPQPAAR